MNYYNEFDPKAAAWIRELIKAGMIPDGEVDERSITDVRPSDLKGYIQHHFFCGIGGWPYALRLAGWPDSKECWSGSCPCQPFSVAGKGKGLEDERHLWPAFRWLIAQCRPSICFGEQVASKDGREWLAGVRSDMEAMGYVVGAADLCAASVGAPHIRQRLFWVADSKSVRSGEGRQDTAGSNERNKQGQGAVIERHVSCFGVADGGLGIANGSRPQQGNETAATVGYRDSVEPANFWDASVWWPCIDGKWRRVPARQNKLQRRNGTNTAAHEIQADTLCPEPSLFPLADGVSGRVGLLRGAGNAIVPQVAAEFIGAVIESIDDLK